MKYETNEHGVINRESLEELLQYLENSKLIYNFSRENEVGFNRRFYFMLTNREWKSRKMYAIEWWANECTFYENKNSIRGSVTCDMLIRFHKIVYKNTWPISSKSAIELLDKNDNVVAVIKLEDY